MVVSPVHELFTLVLMLQPSWETSLTQDVSPQRLTMLVGRTCSWGSFGDLRGAVIREARRTDPDADARVERKTSNRNPEVEAYWCWCRKQTFVLNYIDHQLPTCSVTYRGTTIQVFPQGCSTNTLMLALIRMLVAMVCCTVLHYKSTRDMYRPKVFNCWFLLRRRTTFQMFWHPFFYMIPKVWPH